MDGVIEIEPSRPRPLPVAFCLVTLAWLVATAVIDSVLPAPEVRLMGIERTRMLELEKERRFVDGTLAASFERRLRLRSRVRRTLAPRWVAALLVHAGVGSEDVIVGQDRWLFLRSRACIDEFLAARAPAVTAHTLAAIRRRFAARGTEICVLPIPRKAVACSDRLPPGLDPAPEFDAAILRAIDSAGVPFVDVGATWGGLSSEERFLRYDTHWATPAQAALVERIVERYPSLRVAATTDGSRAVTTERTFEPQDAGLLWYLGLDPASDAAVPLAIPDEERVRLSPDASVAPDGLPEIALVGSSFTASSDLHALLSEALGRDVLKLAVAGAPFADPLVRLAVASASADSDPPALVLFEFPMNQALTLPGFHRPAALALAQLFKRLGPASVTELGEPRTSCRWNPDEVASSGDGALQVALEIDCDGTSRWEMRSSGMHLVWKLEVGEHRLVLPVVDGSDGSSGVRLVALDEGARRARTLGRLAVDVDTSEARECIPGEASPVGPLDVLIVRWRRDVGRAESVHGAVSVTVAGTSRAGLASSTTRTYPATRAEFGVFSVPALDGGSIHAVTVTGADLASARLAAFPQR